MQRRKLFKNKVASVGIIGTLVTLIVNVLMGAVITVPTETGSFQMGRFVINFDQLPKELRDTMLTKGFAWNFTLTAEKIIWQKEHKYVREKFTDIDRITCQLLDFNLSILENNILGNNINNYTIDKPTRIISYMLTAKNKFNVALFYLEVRATIIYAKGGTFVIPYAENRVSSLFRKTWQIHELDRENTTSSVTAEGEFFNYHTQQTITLQNIIVYNITGWHNETYKIEI